jgi:hypothetical protein
MEVQLKTFCRPDDVSPLQRINTVGVEISEAPSKGLPKQYGEIFPLTLIYADENRRRVSEVKNLRPDRKMGSPYAVR